MIICGDALTELRKLLDESVNCCVTSPPYWGLRDYGTAKWEGGDPECYHKNGPLASPKSTLEGYTGPDVKLARGGMPFRDICGKCGARRIDSQLGLERTPEEYVAKLVEVFREVRRVLRKDGSLWLNLGDCYYSGNRGGYDRNRAGVSKNMGQIASDFHAAPNRMSLPGLKAKDLVGIPWRVAFAFQADGWWLRQDIIWAKPNPMPESVTDRCTKAHEYIFMLSKLAKYWYDAEAVREVQITPMDTKSSQTFGAKGGKAEAVYGAKVSGDKWEPSGHHNLRSVWTITTRPFKEAHFATFPPEIPERCIKAGCPIGGIVLDPFFGAGTTGMVAKQLGRDFIGIELNQNYCEMAERRIAQTGYQPGLEMGNA